MRVVQPYAGAERGMYWRPEIGDEVRVGFEGNNVDCPYISGTYYNGQAKPEFFDTGNMIKGWKLRFGMLFKFIEKVGIWLSDPSGNEIHLDEEGKNINATTPETFTIRAKNIVFEATESITYTAGMHISESAGINKSTIVAGILNTNVTGNSFLHVGGNYDANIEGDYNSHTEKDRTISSTDGIETFTEGEHKSHAKGEIHHNSNENTKHN